MGWNLPPKHPKPPPPPPTVPLENEMDIVYSRTHTVTDGTNSTKEFKVYLERTFSFRPKLMVYSISTKGERLCHGYAGSEASGKSFTDLIMSLYIAEHKVRVLEAELKTYEELKNE